MGAEVGRRLVLASGSPRRREILEALGVPFEVRVSHVPEDAAPNAAETPSDFAIRLAFSKSRAIAKDFADSLVLAADTIVVVGGAVLGKPTDEAEAVAMLSGLRGRVHEVITGVALVHLAGGMERTTSRVTRVTFRSFSDPEMMAYIRTGDPFDKAGSYAIQHPLFHPANNIDGCLYNVIGLPACLMWQMLGEADTHLKWRESFDVPPSCRATGCLFATSA